MSRVIAHSLPNAPESEWEVMHEHEERVATFCSSFLKRLHPRLEAWGDLLGRWHDLGKYSSEFQDYIRNANAGDATSETRPGRVDHSTAGAQHAFKVLAQPMRDVFAYAIAGHHAGLADRVSSTGQKSSGLNDRLNKPVKDWSAAPSEMLKSPHLEFPFELLSKESTERCGFQLSLLCRMVFSALCDADFLATEQFMSPVLANIRRAGDAYAIGDLSKRLDAFLARFDSLGDSEVNRCRAEVLASARAAANQPRGMFSLTVPTGGGKTFSLLSFALRHAKQHKMPGVIYAIPFTSIIEQTADKFREVFEPLGPGVVLEHHSNLDPEDESRVARLATQNWDAPLVITTNVQFFESLFANRTSRCRKLHRIAGSVIVFDEIQTLPVKFLKPCLAVIRELVEMFGCTIVLCTATQPAIQYREDFRIGLRKVNEIIDHPASLYERMKRVRAKHLGSIDDSALAKKIARSDQALCIVNTRSHASALYAEICKEVDEHEVFHLSTFMCAAHRKAAFDQIKERLKANLPCRVVSTQLIEAGVDIDFPVVFRALAGLDSIAQAAGRCNREGRHESGSVYLFEPAGRRLFGFLNATAQIAKEIIPLYEDLLSLEAVEHYFRLHYWNQTDKWDEASIMQMFADPANLTFQFRTAAEQFRFIVSEARCVFIPWSDQGKQFEALIRSAAFGDNPHFRRDVLRRAQRFVIPVYENVFNAMVGSDIELMNSEMGILLNMNMYSDRIGLELDMRGHHEPESLIV